MNFIKHFFSYWVVGAIASFAIILLASFLSLDFSSIDSLLVGMIKPGVKIGSLMTDFSGAVTGKYQIFVFSSVFYGFFIALFTELFSRDT